MLAALIGTIIGFMAMAVAFQPQTPRLAAGREADLQRAICALIREGVGNVDDLASGAVQIVYPEHAWPATTPEAEVIYNNVRQLAGKVLETPEARCALEEAA